MRGQRLGNAEEEWETPRAAVLRCAINVQRVRLEASVGVGYEEERGVKMAVAHKRRAIEE